ncbi:MAG: diphthine synthase [Halodesulfurarchaeum sp.]
MLTFVGLGLWDERSVTLRGRDAIEAADRCFIEWYTSRLFGTTVEGLESFHETSIEVRDRAGVEQDPTPILSASEKGNVAFLVAGDPMISTTHVDLRLRAFDRDIETRIVHGPTAQTAASSLTGLQNYRFGKATTLPFPGNHSEPVPQSVIDAIERNSSRDLHTLVYLDIDGERQEYMTGDTAASLLEEPLGVDRLGVVVARAGSDEPVVEAGPLSALARRDFGGPLHLLVIPGDMHPMEREALVAFGDAPDDIGAPGE